jgi:hypothetical protein
MNAMWHHQLEKQLLSWSRNSTFFVTAYRPTLNPISHLNTVLALIFQSLSFKASSMGRPVSLARMS